MKYRFFRHLLGGNDKDSERIYRWHIQMRSGGRMSAGLPTDKWKRSLDDYVESACRLIGSMASGFDQAFAVPVDPAGELLDGSHRVACALALNIADVPIERSLRHVWAPAWDAEWFRSRGMAPAELDRTIADWNMLKA